MNGCETGRGSISKAGVRLLVGVFILVGLGIVMIFSASAVYADQYYGNSAYFLIKQLFFAVLGSAILIFMSMVRPEVLRQKSKHLVLFSVVLLLTVFLPYIGRAGGGARRWLNLVFFSFQPVEVAKLVICIYLSDYLLRKRKLINTGSLTVFVPPFVVLGIIAVLVLMQPDLGSVAFMFAISAIMFFLAGIRLRYIISTVLVSIPVFYFLVVKVPYRFRRIIAFVDPWSDPQGSGFQIIQSFLAFGLGGVKGVGLGESVQKLFYLPQSYTDFIFSIIGEELGFFGAFFVILTFVFIVIQGIMISKRAPNDFQRLLAYSLVLLIVIQAIVNVFVATGLVPTKGLPLPFVSYGGSSLFCNMAAVGILLSIDRRREAQ